MQGHGVISRLVHQFQKSSIRTVTTRHRNKRWEHMFSELLEYRKKHGDTLVPADYPDNPPLGTWVDTQRQQYRVYQENQLLHQIQTTKNSDDVSKAPIRLNTSNITQERIKLLDDSGFIWDVHAFLWEERFNELIEFKKAHGTVVVPKVPQYETLYNWVFTQRRQYKFKLSNQDQSSLTQERIEKLEAIGFIWNYQDEVWMEKFEELRKFKRDHGHCLVPSTYSNRSLAKWVEVQRMHFRNVQKQRIHIHKRDELPASLDDRVRCTSPLTESRIHMLDEENFVWDVAEYHWNIYWQQLHDFVQLNGHAVVPMSGAGSSALGRWCHKQRIEYEKLIQGEKSTMTDLRRDKLLQLGFHFNISTSTKAKYKKRK